MTRGKFDRHQRTFSLSLDLNRPCCNLEWRKFSSLSCGYDEVLIMRTFSSSVHLYSINVSNNPFLCRHCGLTEKDIRFSGYLLLAWNKQLLVHYSRIESHHFRRITFCSFFLHLANIVSPPEKTLSNISKQSQKTSIFKILSKVNWWVWAEFFEI